MQALPTLWDSLITSLHPMSISEVQTLRHMFLLPLTLLASGSSLPHYQVHR
jgi:hypothetical protein